MCNAWAISASVGWGGARGDGGLVQARVWRHGPSLVPSCDRDVRLAGDPCHCSGLPPATLADSPREMVCNPVLRAAAAAFTARHSSALRLYPAHLGTLLTPPFPRNFRALSSSSTTIPPSKKTALTLSANSSIMVYPITIQSHREPSLPSCSSSPLAYCMRSANARTDVLAVLPSLRRLPAYCLYSRRRYPLQYPLP